MGFEVISNEIEADFIICRERHYSRTSLAKMLDTPRQTVAGWAVKKIGPEYIKVGRKVLYSESAIKRWLKEKTVKFDEVDT